MRKKNQKEELPESPGHSEVCRVSSKMKPTRAQGAAPTPGELRIPGDLFVKGRSKLWDCFSSAPFQISDFTRISTPMAMRMQPPSTEACPDSFVPKSFPSFSPPRQMTKVTAAITAEAVRAALQS